MQNETEIDPRFEHRVVASLREGGMIRRSRAPLFLAVAAALVAGFVAGRYEPASRTGREFMLLLHETPASAGRGTVEEYSTWARNTSAMRDGEKLTDQVSVLGPGRSDGSLAGFFRITARSREEAEAIARTCPHLRYGGWIEIREIYLRGPIGDDRTSRAHSRAALTGSPPSSL